MILAMPGKKGRIVGAVILIIGIVSVFVIQRNKPVEEGEKFIRPLKTMVIGKPRSEPGGRYFGKVKALQKAEMSFAVSGVLKSIAVKDGQKVKKGDVLAILDDRDYVNALDSVKADLKKFQSLLGRVQDAAKYNAVSEQDVVNARAAVDGATAQVNIRQKALEDAVLKAKFDGVVAKVFVENFENVQAKQRILSLQDVSGIEIEVDVPESRIAALDPGKRQVKNGQLRFTVGFDYWKERSFDVELNEFATEADPVTQTYKVTFSLTPPKDLTILPGMTAVVTEYFVKGFGDEGVGYSLPLDAVPVDGLGRYYVWKLFPGSGDVYHVERLDVQTGLVTGNNILVTSGLKKGDIVALAGVHILQKGQQVRLLQEN